MLEHLALVTWEVIHQLELCSHPLCESQFIEEGHRCLWLLFGMEKFLNCHAYLC